MKAFLTGGTGFIGRRVARKLVERGYEVRGLNRSQGGAATLKALGVQPVPGDLADRAALRAGMEGCDLVYHIAGWYKIGAHDRSQAEAVNVEGTRQVLGLAHEMGIPRMVYTSTLGVYGDTRGRLADEAYQIPGTESGLGPEFLSEYHRTKWLAHYHVALPLLRQGAPLTIVMPGVTYGPGDPSFAGAMMRWFYLGYLPFVAGPESVFCWAHVDDVAEGHVLAAEKGRPGEIYHLAGPALTLGDTYDTWADVTGLPAPKLRLPAPLMKPSEPLMTMVGRALPVPELLSDESIKNLGTTQLGTAAKARAELGWQVRPPAEGFMETFAALAKELGPAPRGWAARNKPALVGMAALSSVTLASYLLRRRRDGRQYIRAGSSTFSRGLPAR